ncbi:MAG: twin-arginine translocase TatA/TatE family subunit [Actinobacteria bacterium]|nr:twin-arginine translocase TatA/TatE family subunit [Actinomycetota bacterium]MCL5882391.1 twin-arginine translocase TatA/TatE family subunit [Actinomycetota bacterium]
MFGELLSPMHMLFILIVVLIIFGPKRLPEIGKSLGKGIKEFKKATTDIQDKLGDDDASAAKIDKAEAEKVKEPMQAPEAKVAPEPSSAETKTT